MVMLQQNVQDTDARVMEGSISASGKVLSGAGFTVTHETTGVYIVKFDEPFYFSPPTIQRIEVVNPFYEPYGYKVEVVGTVTTGQFKYFTYQLTDHNIVMKDIEVSYFYAWGFKDPND